MLTIQTKSQIVSNKEYRKEHIEEMCSWDLVKKIHHAKTRIKEFYEEMDGKVYIAHSGGKDSVVLCDLVRSIYPDVVSVFSNTTNEFVEILKFVRSVDNLIEIHPKMTFNETVEEYGFPLVSKMSARKIHDIKYPTEKNATTVRLYRDGIFKDGTVSTHYKLSDKWMFLTEEEFDVTNKCCDILKKEPLKRFEKESGLKPFIGTQTGESRMRRDSWIKTGCNSFNDGGKASRPLSIWTTEDIWNYIRMNNLEYCEVYDDKLDEHGNVIVEGEKRTGCEYCAYGAHLEKSDLINQNRFQRSKLRKPKRFEKMMNLKNNGITFREALGKVGVKL